MNVTMTADHFQERAPMSRQEMPVIVQIISTGCFGGFAIVSVIFAFNAFWPAGVLIALILGWRGGFSPSNFTQVSAEEIAEKIKTLSPEAKSRTSGNASFDAYRRDMMQRLENEQDNFENFLVRLRDAKDRSEFDTFLDERARRAKAVSQDD